MGQVFEGIDDDLAAWLRRQHLFFVATAPRSDDGHVNLSPKGLDTFDILDAHTVAYLDLTGSGVETIAHVRENGRITLMFCAFAGAPRIVRLQGRGHAYLPGSPEFDRLVSRFPQYLSTRSIISVDLNRIADSCGYGVPLLSYNGERRALQAWAEKQGRQGILDYRATKNATSIDALPGLPTG